MRLSLSMLLLPHMNHQPSGNNHTLNKHVALYRQQLIITRQMEAISPARHLSPANPHQKRGDVNKAPASNGQGRARFAGGAWRSSREETRKEIGRFMLAGEKGEEGSEARGGEYKEEEKACGVGGEEWWRRLWRPVMGGRRYKVWVEAMEQVMRWRTVCQRETRVWKRWEREDKGRGWKAAFGDVDRGGKVHNVAGE